MPFSLGVWIVMIIMVFIFTAALLVLTWTFDSLNGTGAQYSTVLDTITMVLGAVCQQGNCCIYCVTDIGRYWKSLVARKLRGFFLGAPITMKSVPARLATFVLFLFAVFLFTSYAASIVVLLQSPSQTIRDVRDFIDKSITFSAQDTKHNYIYFNVIINIKYFTIVKLWPRLVEFLKFVFLQTKNRFLNKLKLNGLRTKKKKPYENIDKNCL